MAERTEKQIVSDANGLAREFYSMLGYQVEDGYRFDQAHHPQEVAMWRMACKAYEMIDGTDVDECLNLIDDDE